MRSGVKNVRTVLGLSILWTSLLAVTGCGNDGDEGQTTTYAQDVQAIPRATEVQPGPSDPDSENGLYHTEVIVRCLKGAGFEASETGNAGVDEIAVVQDQLGVVSNISAVEDPDALTGVAVTLFENSSNARKYPDAARKVAGPQLAEALEYDVAGGAVYEFESGHAGDLATIKACVDMGT